MDEQIELNSDKPSRKYGNREWLRQRYVEDNMSIEDIAEMCNVNVKTVSQHLINRNIVDGPSSQRHKYGRFNVKQWLQQKYDEEKMSISEISRECRVSSGLISERLDDFGIEKRNTISKEKDNERTTNVNDEELRDIFR